MSLSSHIYSFETHYTPWMNLAHTDPLGTSPRSLTDFLTLTRCTVASRHLPPDSFTVVLPRLQKLVEHAVLVHMFNASKSPSLGAAQALLILSLWSPAVGPLASVVQDGGLIVKSAIKMGLAMGLDHAMDELVASRQRARMSDKLSEDEEREDDVLIYKSRLVGHVHQQYKTNCSLINTGSGMRFAIQIACMYWLLLICYLMLTELVPG